MMQGNFCERARLWVAMGNQPGAGIWFALWQLTRQRAAGRRAAAFNKLQREGCAA